MGLKINQFYDAYVSLKNINFGEPAVIRRLVFFNIYVSESYLLDGQTSSIGGQVSVYRFKTSHSSIIVPQSDFLRFLLYMSI